MELEICDIFNKMCLFSTAGLGEFRIRDLNDEINKLLREKRHWENQISALGGPHYRRYGPKMFDSEGREVPGNRGYKYFGAAKDLPGVRELFEQDPPPPPRKTRAELMKDIDAHYYGYFDDDDNVLIPLEEKAEKIATQRALQEWKEKQKSHNADGNRETNAESDDDDATDTDYGLDFNESAKERTQHINDDPMGMLAPRFTSHVPVPSQKDIEAALLRKKKQELLEKYGIGNE